MASLEFRGVREMQARIADYTRDLRQSANQAAEAEAEAIAERVRELVPVASGNLRDTIRVMKGELSQGRDEGGRFTSGSSIEVVIAAGDSTTPQALAIHEHPSQHDPPSWRGADVTFNPAGTGEKYLERPMREAASSGMMDRIGRKVFR